MKVYWTDPEHDAHVHEAIGQAMHLAGTDARFRDWGIGVIDFADCTVVTLSRSIPQGEVFVMERKDENSILHGGFGDNPFPAKPEPVNLMEHLTEVRNPDAPRIFTTGKK